MMRIPAVATLFSILIWGLVTGCAEQRPAIDRVQPNALPKTQFDGEYYYVRTVVDVPSANGFTFVGHTDHSGMTKVTFDVQEDVLYARRSTELIKGADDKATAGDNYMGEVVAAFKIEKHFDIVNAYNPTTGEQLNIIEENTTDRPWYARSYMRVNWSHNLVTNYQLDFESAATESVPYYVQETDPETGERNPDAPLFEEDGSYFDITSKIFAKAGSIELPPYGEIPLCWLRGEEFTECGAGEYTIRHSFKKIDPNHQYEPLAYKGKATEVFGYFTTDRLNYDNHEGIIEQGKERYMNRHNLWVNWVDDKGEPIEPAKRTLRPVVYHVNRDFPDDLKPIAADVAEQWNVVFTDTVKAMGHEPKGDVFIACLNNPVLEGDPAECGGAGNSPRLGDIRYSFMAYVPKYMTYGLLGLGPSNNDPETGEIISGMGYVYHHNNLAAYRVQEMLELLNGDRDPSDFIDGVDLTDWVKTVNGETEKPKRTYGLDDAEHMVDRIANGWRSKYWEGHRHTPTQEDVDFQKEHGFEKWIAPVKQQLYEQGILNGEMHSPEGKLATLKDTYVEDLLLNKEILLAGGAPPNMPVLEHHKDAASVARGGFGNLLKVRDRLREEYAAANNMYLPEMADDALIGLARDLKGEDPEKAYAVVRKAIYTAVLAHEVGHSLGLMHNFGGSDDAINYHDEYWKIRDDGTVSSRLVDPITEDEKNAKIYNYAYSSVMDYAGRYTIDGLGIGKYDRAAILFGYAGKVEVFKDRVDVPYTELRDWYERDGDVFYFSNPPQAVHYTSFYNRMGDKLYKADNRKLVDVSTLVSDFSQTEETEDDESYTRVPYIYCSHSRANLGDSCLTRDYGADPMERMSNILDDLDTWYITRNFVRGKLGVDSNSYVGRWYGRIYNRMKRWHDLYGLYNEFLAPFYGPTAMKQFLTDPITGWGAQTWAVQNAFNYLIQTLLMPDVGRYNGPYATADDHPVWLKTFGGDGTDLDVTSGRYYSTSWGDGDRECGYMFWECLHHVGFYLDKIMAIEALSDSTTNFVARATPEDLREWEVSYYTTFADQITQISSAIMSQDWSRVGPYLENGKLTFPNYAGNLGEVHFNAVDPYATFSVQLYWQVLGQARFHSNFNQSFVDESRVFIKGTGAAPSVDDKNLVQFTDPLSQITYGAIRFNDRVGSGQSVLERANTMQARSDFCDKDGTLTPWPADDCQNISQANRSYFTGQFLDHIELVKVMSDISPMMGFGDPYNP